jgi:hypothetical protein
MAKIRQPQTDIQDADQIDYDDAVSGLNENEVQGAIDTVVDWLSAANGVIKQTISLAISSNGTIITAAVGAAVGTTLRFKFSDGLTDIDVTAAKTVSLTPGTDTVPQENFIYFLKTDPTTLVNSTSGFPAAEHAPVGRIVVQSAATVQSDGVLKQHDYTDHLIDNNDQGHITHLNDWIRSQHGTWLSGVAPTVSGSGTGTINVGTTSGVVKQLHSQAFPAISSPADAWVVNDFTTKFNKITNLGAGITTDSGGTSLTNRWYTLVLWASASQSGSSESKLFVNVPSGSYATSSGAIEDADKTVNFSVPNDFVGVGFLVQKIVLRNNAGTTWTIDTSGNNDLRGLFPNTDAGSTTATATEFPDSQFKIFNNADNTKELDFDVSAISTATIRTISAPDRDLDLDIPQFSQVGIGKDPASGIELDVLGESIFDGVFSELRGPSSGGTFAFGFDLRFGREGASGYDESIFFIPRIRSNTLEVLGIVSVQNLELISEYIECKTPSSSGISSRDTIMFDVTGDSGPNAGFNAVNAAFEYMAVLSNNKDDATSDILALRMASVAAPGTTNEFLTFFKSSNTKIGAFTGLDNSTLRYDADFTYDADFLELRGQTSPGTFAFDFDLRFGREGASGYDESTFFVPRILSPSTELLKLIGRQSIMGVAAHVQLKNPDSESVGTDKTMMLDATGESGSSTGFNAANASFEYMTVLSNEKNDSESDVLALRLANIAAPGTTNHFITMFKSSNAEYAAFTGGASGELRLTTDFNIDDAGGLQVQGTKVVGVQGAAVANATDAASAITQLNALLARSRTHGLIAA